MIFDNIGEIQKYSFSRGIHNVLKRAAEINAGRFLTGKVELEDGNYMILSSYETNISNNVKMECHRKFIDVMYMVEGAELIRVKNISKISKFQTPYDMGQDVMFADCDDDYSLIRLNAGDFLVLYPQDVHAPGLAIDAVSSHVKKVIGKVHI